ncbi:MAG: hypothetical protein ABW185_29095 [Sedimenticola sp.]
MKYLLPFLIAPAIVFAQAPGQGKMSKQDYFGGIKGRMQQVMALTIPAMEQTQGCLQQAEERSALNGCIDIMAGVQRKMMSPRAAGHGAQAVPKRPDIEWSEEIKGKMLKDLERALAESKATSGCFDTSTTSDQMDACMAKSGLGSQ